MTALTRSELETWNTSFPSLITAIGESGLFELIDESLQKLVGFDISCIFSYEFHCRPQLLHDGLKDVSSAIVMSRYLNGTYLLDAVYNACRNEIKPGLYRLSQLAPDNFFNGEYYNSPEFHPCISMESGALSEEIVFINNIDKTYIAYSLLRHKYHSRFSKREFLILQSIASTILALLTKQCQMSGTAAQRELHDSDASDNRVSQALETFAQNALTPREQTIVAMILRGHSNTSIASELFITAGTVKNHRKNIYSKLKIHKQSQLFTLFIKHIFGDVREY